MEFKVACQFELKNGKRCPEWAEISRNGFLTCREHSSGEFVAALQPDTILFLFYLGKKGFAQANEAGMRMVERKTEAIADAHRRHAEVLGLDPQSNDPRIGAGTSVFNPTGVPDVSINCVEEVRKSGYTVQDVHGYAREKGGTVVLALSKKRSIFPDENVQKFFMTLLDSSWHLYLYAFPPDQDGETCHVTEGHMRKAEKGEKAFWKLGFDRGLWKLTPRESQNLQSGTS